MVIVLPFETPSKKNSRMVDRRTGRTFPSKAFKEWHKKALAYVMANYRIDPFQGPVSISLEFTHPTLRLSDADNKVSSIFDLLVDLRIIQDDNWKVITSFAAKNFYKKGEASCKVEISQAV